MASQDDVLLSGTVEVDEAYFGGDAKWKHKNEGLEGSRYAVQGPGSRDGATPRERGVREGDGGSGRRFDP
jgi:hypothetical protein